jgi:hypothetical protein
MQHFMLYSPSKSFLIYLAFRDASEDDFKTDASCYQDG